MRTMRLLSELLADSTWRRLVLLAVLVLVPAATLMPAAVAPGVGRTSGPLAALSLIALSVLGAGMLLLAASLPVAGATIRLRGLPWRELPERTAAAAIGGIVGLAGAVLLLAPSLLVAYGLLPWLGWVYVALSLIGCGWLMLLSAAAAEVGPSRAPAAVCEFLRRDGVRVSVLLGLLGLGLLAGVADLFRIGLQDAFAVWLVASAACLAPTAATLVWQAERPASAQRHLAAPRQDILATAARDLAGWLTAETEADQETAETLSQMRSSAAAISSGRPFGSGRA